MNIDAYGYDDHELSRIAARVPSTTWGNELMRDGWPKLYTQLMSSETYRGCISVLAMLAAQMRAGMRLGEIEQLIERADRSVKSSSPSRLDPIAAGVRSSRSRTPGRERTAVSPPIRWSQPANRK